jgi:2-amino-4-hydroxy-6-hydroxymethyldihydropteridine diphosphokinase
MEAREQAIIMSGSNLGNREQNLLAAKQLIEKLTGTVIKASVLYQSEPWNLEGEPEFLNQALLMETTLPAIELMKTLHSIENQLGRVRGTTSASRTLDLDLIFFSDLVINERDLTIPHPRMHLRRFNLLPINEIAPSWKHPVLKLEIQELLRKCTDPLAVSKYNQLV